MHRYELIKVLLIEDNPGDVILMRDAMEACQLSTFELITVETLAEGIKRIQQDAFDIVLLDLNLPDSSGIQTFNQIHQANSDVPVVVFSGNDSIQQAIDAVRAGAQDYIVKSLENYNIATRTIQYAIERHSSQRKLAESAAQLKGFLDSSPDALIIVNAAGKIIFANLQVEKLFGYKQEELLQQDLGILIPQRVRDAHKKHQESFFLEPRAREMGSGMELRAQAQDGSEVPVEITLSSHQMDNETVVLSSIRNITERKQREHERETLLTLATSLRTASSGREMITVVIDHTVSWLDLDGAAIALLNNTSGETIIEAAKGSLESWHQMHILPGQGVVGQVIASNDLYIADTLKVDESTDRESIISVCLPLFVDNTSIGALCINSKRPMQMVDMRLLEGIANMSAIAIQRALLLEQTLQHTAQLAEAYEKNIEGWSRALDLRDKETEGHTLRVTTLTLILARAVGITEAEIIHIRRGALLHDIGKMGVPDQILLKPGKLTEEEWEQMRQHPSFAYQLLAPISFLSEALDIPYCHHEYWDGSGYPRGLKGEEIPLSARVFSVVDVWDALTSDRPYRAGWSKEKTMAYIQNLSGVQFDPIIVEVFTKLMSDGTNRIF